MSGRSGRLTAVFFDFGDTLWHFPERTPDDVVERTITRRFRALLSMWGAEPTRTAAEMQRALLQARADAERAADAGDLRSPDYHELTRRVAVESGLALSDEQIATLWEAHNAGGPLLGRRLFEDAHETLEWLAERRFRIGAITNRAHGGEAFLDELRYHGLLRHFEVVISSDQTGWRKPHRAIFEHALDAMGVTAAESALVGDRPDADVRGARAMGMTAIWIRKVTSPDRTPAGADEQPHYTIDELSELRAVPPLAAGPGGRRRRAS